MKNLFERDDTVAGMEIPDNIMVLSKDALASLYGYAAPMLEWAAYVDDVYKRE